MIVVRFYWVSLVCCCFIFKCMVGIDVLDVRIFLFFSFREEFFNWKELCVDYSIFLGVCKFFCYLLLVGGLGFRVSVFFF